MDKITFLQEISLDLNQYICHIMLHYATLCYMDTLDSASTPGRTNSNSATVWRSIRVPTSLYGHIEALARSKGVSVSFFARELLMRAMGKQGSSKHPSVPDAVTKRGKR